MRTALAALIDSAFIAALGFIAFQFAVLSAPCASLGACTILAPLAILSMLVLLFLYFGAGYVVWKTTPGRALTGMRGDG